MKKPVLGQGWRKLLKRLAASPKGGRLVRLAGLALTTLISLYLLLRLTRIGWGRVWEAVPETPWFYLALAAKSNAATIGIMEARADVREGRLLPVPVHLRDSHYGGAQRLGHGQGPACLQDAERQERILGHGRAVIDHQQRMPQGVRLLPVEHGGRQAADPDDILRRGEVRDQVDP